MKRVKLNTRAQAKVRKVTADEVEKGQAGRPEFVPTDKQRANVKRLCGYGLKQDEIRQFVLNEDGSPISVPTLLKHFRRELDIGMLEVAAKIGRSVNVQALGQDAVMEPLRDEITGDIIYNQKTGEPKYICVRPPISPDIKAAIWFEKTRRGYKEGMTLEHTGKDGKDLPAGNTVIYHLPDNGRGGLLLTDGSTEVYAPNSGKGDGAKQV